MENFQKHDIDFIIVLAFLAASFIIDGSDQLLYKIPVIFYWLEKLKSIL